MQFYFIVNKLVLQCFKSNHFGDIYQQSMKQPCAAMFLYSILRESIAYSQKLVANMQLGKHISVLFYSGLRPSHETVS